MTTPWTTLSHVSLDQEATEHTASFRPRIYILESDAAVRGYLETLLQDRYDLGLFGDQGVLLEKLNQGPAPDVLLVAWYSTEETRSLLMTVTDTFPNLPIVVLSCSTDLTTIVTATKLGARDIVLKPFLGNDLHLSIEEHMDGAKRNAPENEHAPKEIPLTESKSFVCYSKHMRDIESQAALVARADIPVLVLGESGTGKEILALYLHKMSSRSQQTFLKVNCAAMPADLIESELFGHEQGAFTGAVKAKQGKFEVCNGGTIFLDEIGEMPALLQAKLLQVLQDGTFTRLGGRSTLKTNVRVIAATNINMKQALAQKTFREDLYFRLNGFTLHVPPLRERKEEVPIMANHFMRKAAERYGCTPLPFSKTLMDAFHKYDWPGNLREMENIVNRYLILGNEKEVLREILPSETAQCSLEATAMRPQNEMELKQHVRDLKREAESAVIARKLGENGWNRKAAANDLKISYKALLYKIKQYNLEENRTA